MGQATAYTVESLHLALRDLEGPHALSTENTIALLPAASAAAMLASRDLFVPRT